MMRHYVRLLLVCALTATLAGCHSSRHAQRGDTTIVEGETATAHGSEARGVSAKLKLTLEANGKSISCGGTYRLLRDDVVQISLTYSVFIVSVNVGTLELTRDNLLLIDRMGKRYCRMAYADIPELKAAGVDFDYLQRIFWGDAEGETNSYVDFTYGDWTQLGDGGRLPQKATVRLKGDKAQDYQIVLELSKVQEDTSWETRTDIPSGYEEVSLGTVMNAITKVAK